MMLVLTEDALLLCSHKLGKVAVSASQDWVTIRKRSMLVWNDPEGKSIGGCPNTNVMAGIAPCLRTLVAQRGYSTLVRVGGRAVCLSTLEGFTNGTPPGLQKYDVQAAGQQFVSEKS